MLCQLQKNLMPIKSEDVEFVTSLSEATKEDVVVVSVYGGVAGGKIEGNDLKGDDGKLYIKRAFHYM